HYATWSHHTAHHATAHHVAWHGPELLLLFWVQQLTDILHGGDMGQTHVSLFGGNGLEQLLHFGEIHRIGFQQGRDIERHCVDLGLEANDLLGVIAQQHLDLGTLLLTELELLAEPFEVLLQHHTPMSHHAAHRLHHGYLLPLLGGRHGRSI